MSERPTDRGPLIMVIDDDVSVRTSLDRLLSAAGLHVETFPSAEVYLERAPYQGVGCIILDVCMRGLSGAELQVQLANRGSNIPIVFLTGHGSIPLSVSALKQGAADFLTKPVDEEVLLQAIHQALERSADIVRSRLETHAIRERLETLTPRELQVMRAVLTGALNKQIAARLGIAEKTVKVHRGRIMEKLQICSVAELVRFCNAAGVAPTNA